MTEKDILATAEDLANAIRATDTATTEKERKEADHRGMKAAFKLGAMFLIDFHLMSAALTRKAEALERIATALEKSPRASLASE